MYISWQEACPKQSLEAWQALMSNQKSVKRQNGTYWKISQRSRAWLTMIEERDITWSLGDLELFSFRKCQNNDREYHQAMMLAWSKIWCWKKNPQVDSMVWSLNSSPLKPIAFPVKPVLSPLSPCHCWSFSRSWPFHSCRSLHGGMGKNWQGIPGIPWPKKTAAPTPPLKAPCPESTIFCKSPLWVLHWFACLVWKSHCEDATKDARLALNPFVVGGFGWQSGRLKR